MQHSSQHALNRSNASIAPISEATERGVSEIPTGPRSMRQPSSRPPAGPGFSSNGRANVSGTHVIKAVSVDEAPRQLNRRVDQDGVPIVVSSIPASASTTATASAQNLPSNTPPDSAPAYRSSSQLKKDESAASARAGFEAPAAEIYREKPGSAIPTAEIRRDSSLLSPPPSTTMPEIPGGPKKAVVLTKEDLVGSACSELEAQCHNHTTSRLKSYHSLYATEPFASFRKALQELDDSDLELAGARVKTMVAEMALSKAKDEAEAWNLECSRVEINERKSGILGYFTTASSTQQQQQQQQRE
ncbi:hypothetical protein CBS101457_004030 [Exobasidium rhododendri]|nr:hypothetical protein CBS101457_004030 [Exobasidium rhododendri]